MPLPLDSEPSRSSGDTSDGSSSGIALARPPIWPAIGPAIAEAAGEAVAVRSLPFASFAARLDVPPDAGPHLARIYKQLLGRCRAFVEEKTGQAGLSPLDGSLSYNLGECAALQSL